MLSKMKPNDMQPEAIDFNSMLRQEKLASKHQLAVKQISANAVYNLLMDMRHLIIIDFRSQEEYTSAQIRRSLRGTMSDFN
jgi:hypothetical protein